MHRREHPLALWFSGSIALVSVLAFVYPASVQESPQSLALSFELRQFFYVVWGVGGGLSFAGLWRGSIRAEAAGMAMMGFAFLAYAAVIISLLGLGRGSYIFLVGIAMGCIHRSWHLSVGRG
jgi:hypothetical protein